MNLKEILKNRLRNAGLNEELADTLNITDESQIEGVINLLKPTQTIDFEKILTSDEFNQFAESKGFDGVLALSKFLQSKHDQKVTQGIETFKQKQNQKPDVSKEEEPNGSYLKELQELKEQISNLTKKDEQSRKMELVKQAFSKSKLPERFQDKWINRINLEEDVNKQIQDLEFEYDELQSSFVKSNSGSGLPIGNPSTREPADEQVNEILTNM